MNNKIDIIINKIKNTNDSLDINFRNLKINNKKICLVFIESVASDDKITDFIGKSLCNINKKNIFKSIFNHIKNKIPNSKIKTISNYNDVFFYLTCGFTCIIIDGYNKCIAVETKAILDRSISESTSEPIIRGPKESFNENIITNIGLIRKRIKDKNLVFKEIIVGEKTNTKIVISYLKDTAKKQDINKVINKIKKINVDAILDTNQIQKLITNQKTIFPRVITTERPDIISIGLLKGKIAILSENSPYALLLPSTLNDFFKTSDDYYINNYNAFFIKIIRYIAFFIAIFTPAIYIAITTYNIEVIPIELLTSFSIARENVPFPTIIETLILIISYEILKEADTRKPQVMGASISIVGALILGDAAVNANIISPIVVIIISISAVAGMIFSNIDLTNAIRVWRIFFMIAAAFFGLIGIVTLFIIFIIKLSEIEVLETPYIQIKEN